MPISLDNKAAFMLAQLRKTNKHSIFIEGENFCFDSKRRQRTGMLEAIYAKGKRFEDILNIVNSLAQQQEDVFITKADKPLFTKLQQNGISNLVFKETAKIIHTRKQSSSKTTYQATSSPKELKVALVSGGSSDLPPSSEALVTLEFMGVQTTSFLDLGLASLERLLLKLPEIEKAQVVIAACGMEASLASVLAGLCKAPVIGLPCSSGYGVNESGMNALFSILGSCAPGLAAVNIDNGFGAAALAIKILNSYQNSKVKPC